LQGRSGDGALQERDARQVNRAFAVPVDCLLHPPHAAPAHPFQIVETAGRRPHIVRSFSVDPRYVLIAGLAVCDAKVDEPTLLGEPVTRAGERVRHHHKRGFGPCWGGSRAPVSVEPNHDVGAPCAGPIGIRSVVTMCAFPRVELRPWSAVQTIDFVRMQLHHREVDLEFVLLRIRALHGERGVDRD
jgi:hypothetical protein